MSDVACPGAAGLAQPRPGGGSPSAITGSSVGIGGRRGGKSGDLRSLEWGANREICVPREGGQVMRGEALLHVHRFLRFTLIRIMPPVCTFFWPWAFAPPPVPPHPRTLLRSTFGWQPHPEGEVLLNHACRPLPHLPPRVPAPLHASAFIAGSTGNPTARAPSFRRRVQRQTKPLSATSSSVGSHRGKMISPYPGTLGHRPP